MNNQNSNVSGSSPPEPLHFPRSLPPPLSLLLRRGYVFGGDKGGEKPQCDKDQLEFFHVELNRAFGQTAQVQQRAERDAAVARLEQSRIVLSLRLSEHHGKKYKVIEEALAFVADVHDANAFVSPESLYVPPEDSQVGYHGWTTGKCCFGGSQHDRVGAYATSGS